jgi:hypothetical protein
VSTVLDRVLPDLEAMAAAGQEPEYVLAFMPSFLAASPWRRLAEPSYWELFTVAEYEAGMPCRDDWRTPAGKWWTEERLALWVRFLLGFPVALEYATTEIKAHERGRRWHQVPLYWVRRDT